MARRKFKIHLLDMGDKDYGDAIVVQANSITALIDGGHPGDQRSRPGFASLPEQIAKVLDREPPFRFDLLVVTHAHLDHIGALPAMVADGTIAAKWALVADPDLGWGVSEDNGDPFDAPNATLRKVLAGLREEPPSRLSDAQLDEFLEDSVRLSARYRTMLDELAAAGTKVVRLGRDDLQPLLQAFRDAGLSFLGPTQEHLLKCAAVIDDIGRDSRVRLESAAEDDGPEDAVALYRSLTATGADAADRRGIGAALNNQSAILMFKVDGKKALLTGDMQFAAPEVDGLETNMEGLRGVIAALAPFSFVKFAHHASYNAVDASVLDELEETTCFGISTGRGDVGHPARSVLALLRERRDEITWARTDRNGLITFDLSGDEPQVSCQRGSVNNTRINSDASREASTIAAPAAPVPLSPAPLSPALPVTPAVEPAAIAPSPASLVAPARTADTVEVVTRIPHVATQVTVTIKVEPQGQSSSVASAAPTGAALLPDAGFQLAGGRRLPPLLFVTNRGQLAQNIGANATAAVINSITQAGHPILTSLPPTVGQAAPLVRAELNRHPSVRGVVLLGGYDVVPPQKFDTIDPQLRAQLRGRADDGDNFVVWRDAIYGDTDGDAEQELPVTRIPDGRSKELVYAALQAAAPGSTSAFGIRNLARPFADEIWQQLSAANLPSCEPQLVGQVRPSDVAAAGRLYFMLHGDDVDTTRFWGEGAAGGYPEAFNLSCVPQAVPAILLTGCCWGALTSQVTARGHVAGQPVVSRTPATSLAMAFLRSGVQAFVGCTGSHYSPTVVPYGYFGGPLHESFWRLVLPPAGTPSLPPAEALFEAKKEYLAGMPHGQTSPKAIAIELKILHQFHCLGLGW